MGGFRPVGTLGGEGDIELLDPLGAAVDEQQPGKDKHEDDPDDEHNTHRVPVAVGAEDVQPIPGQGPRGEELADVGIDPAQGDPGDQGEADEQGDEQHLRQDDPEGGLPHPPVLILQLAEEDAMDKAEEVEKGDGSGEEEDHQRQPRLAIEDGVIEDPTPTEAGQGRHPGDGDDANEHGDEGQGHEGDEPAHAVHVTGAGPFGDPAQGEEQHGLVDVVVDDEHQGHEPAQVVHQGQTEEGVAHLTDGGPGQEALGVLLKGGEQVAEEGGQGTDPQDDVG